jgi:HD-GYP domain-containing protein (c-di-GMP phosphodiesterase class II)
MPDPLDDLPVPALRIESSRVVAANATARKLLGNIVGRTMPALRHAAPRDVPLPDARGDTRQFRLAAAGVDLFTLTDVTDLRDAHDALAEVANRVLDNAETYRHDADVLEQAVRQRTAELHQANHDAVMMLAVASEAKDADTGAHVLRIRRTTEALATELGESAMEAGRLGVAAILHDVGKIHVPDAVLQKPGKLTPEERKLIERHTLDGERILGRGAFFATARQVARHHHENYDGTGYPDGLKGEAIPMPARLVHVADVFDALTNKRVYKPAWTDADAAAVLRESIGLSFDPDIVAAFDKLHARGFFANADDAA